MKLIADHNIPFLHDLFSQYAQIIALPAADITPKTLKDAQILLTRTITNIGPELLSDTAIEFVGSAATGTDHIDLDWLSKQNIALATAAGANATAVVDYVISCVAALKQKNLLSLDKKKVAGIIGYGRIGSKVAPVLKQMGFEVICHDPFKENQPDETFVALDTLLSNADLITIHTPLTKTGPHPTYHLLNQTRLQSIKPGSILINSARGSVIDNAALEQIDHLITCLDVWENEPDINISLLDRIFIGTPHIAGYTLEAKYRATEMIFEAAAKHFNWPASQQKKTPFDAVPQNTPTNLTWEEQILSIHDPIDRSDQLKKAIYARSDRQMIQDVFIAQRNLPYRRAIDDYHLELLGARQ